MDTPRNRARRWTIDVPERVVTMYGELGNKLVRLDRA